MSDAGVPSDISGRKIFFLYPTGSVEHQIVTELIQQEYEIYIIRDHSRMPRTLSKYRDSVVYVNIDEKMREDEWDKWIRGLKASLPELKFGVFSSTDDEDIKNKYVNEIRVECGFIGLKLDMSRSVNKILEILAILNIKGRRKYIRASTARETTATINMPYGGSYINGVIKDVSVVGISCVFDHDPELTKNALFKDIQIRLQSMLLKVEAIAFGSRMDGNEKNYVLIFTQRIDPDVKVKIRKYIQSNLQSKMDAELK